MSDERPPGTVTAFPIPFDELPSKITIALVDDCAVDRMRVGLLLRNCGIVFEIDEFCSLSEFRDGLPGRAYDLVILDYLLPVGTGLEALRLLNGSPVNACVATIMLTTQAEVHVAVAAMKYGCSDYIVKEDLTPATLLRAIHNALQKANLQRKVNDAAIVLGRLQGALKRQVDRSASEIRPLVEKTLKQVTSMHYLQFLDRENGEDARIEVMKLTCRNMLLFCDEIERAEDVILSELK